MYKWLNNWIADIWANIVEVWTRPPMNLEWWNLLLMTCGLFLLNLVLFWAMWIVRKEVAFEVGYSTKKRKKKRKEEKQYSLIERFLLVRITVEADKKGFMLYFNLFNHGICLCALAACCIGAVCTIITNADGWAFTLLLYPGYHTFFITGLLEFVPHYLCMPSVRKKYRS